jgi:delta(3,5)-delta(2,4)-dienoyl-CoA isomerase
MTSQTTYFLLSRPAPHVVHVEINRPSKLNAFIEAMWIELNNVFDKLSRDSSVRAIVLSGAGERAFSAGLDVQAAAQSGLLASTDDGLDPARKAVTLRRRVQDFQEYTSAVERCEKRTYHIFLSL